MIPQIKLASFSFILIVIFFSCRKDPKFVLDDQLLPPECYVSDEPCSYDLTNTASNSTIKISCLLDLKGDTITLPENVNFDFDGGQIINGGLIFSGGYIDGRLLSSQFDVSGDVRLRETVFKFLPCRWDIIEGDVTREVALANNTKFEKLMFKTQEMGATVFDVNDFDAYFLFSEVTSTTANQNFYPTKESINVPSNFHLKMSDLTYLRVFPATDYEEGGVLLAVSDVENVIISGGNLIGDRDVRAYSIIDAGQDGSHLFTINAGRNITVDGVNFVDGSKGSVNIHSTGFSFNPDYNPTTGVVIKNCKFENSRRMAIALTDGRDILIEGNTFIDAGQASTKSSGGEVGYAINIEPYRSADSTGYILYQLAFDVTIRNNTEKNSRIGAVTATIGQDIIIEDNIFERRVVYSFVSGIKIRNNTFNFKEGSEESFAIFAAGVGTSVFDNEISNNTINDYPSGIITKSSGDILIKDNKINNCNVGLFIKESNDVTIVENQILNNRSGSVGISFHLTWGKNTLIKDNLIDVVSNPFKSVHLNQDPSHSSYLVRVVNNQFKSKSSVVLSNSKGIEFSGNTHEGQGVLMFNASNITFNTNTITTGTAHGFSVTGTGAAISLTLNTISIENDSYDCINIDDSVEEGAVANVDNTCL